MIRRLPMLVALACLTIARPGGAALVTSPPPGPVIGRLVQRHDVIVIRAGRQGPTYASESRGGATLSPDMTMEQMAVANPKLHERVSKLNAAVAWAAIDVAE